MTIGNSEKYNFFDTSKHPCKEGDFLFSTDTENGGDMEIVVSVAPTDYKTYTPSNETVRTRQFANWDADKLRVGKPTERTKMVGHFLTDLAFEQTRIDSKRGFFAKLSIGIMEFDPIFMTKRDFL